MADDIPISGLPPAPPLDGTENLPVLKGGTNYKATTQAVANLVPGLSVQIQNLNPRETLDGSEPIVVLKNGVAYRSTVQAIVDLATPAETDPVEGLPPGGTTGQVLTKLSNASYHVGWTTPVVTESGPPPAASGTLVATEAGDTVLILGPISSITGTLSATGASDTAAISGTIVSSGASAVTWSPVDKSPAIQLSNGNLTATRELGSGHAIGRATLSRTTGDFYFECTIGSAVDLAVGLANASQALSGDYLGNSPNSIAYYNSGYIQHGVYASSSPAFYSSAASYTTNDVIGIRWGATDGTGIVRLYKNGALVFTSPSIALGAAFPTTDLRDSGDEMTANFGASPLTLPSGAASWNSAISEGGGDASALTDELGGVLVDESGAALTS